MKLTNAILATFNFELYRMMTIHRVGLAIVMVLFPPAMIFVISRLGGLEFPEFVISVFCGMICLLSLLLWATPNVYAELEGKNWTFVVSSPNGRWSILFGKYMIAFLWSFLVSWISLSLCILIIHPSEFQVSMPFNVWWVFSFLLLLASMVYASVFSLLGVTFQRRAMVFGVGYFLLFEVFLALLPANIGKISMTYHLFCIGVNCLGWFIPKDIMSRDDFATVWGVYSTWLHMGVIAIVTIVALSAAAFVIRKKEYITLEDAQV